MLSTAASTLSPLNLAAISSERQLRQFNLINIPTRHFAVSCSAKSPWTEHFQDPTKLTILLNKTKEKLWKVMPDSVQSFPWKNAGIVAVEEFLLLGKETLKWSLLACFAFSFLSDILYSISMNKELVIPFGLFIGIMTNKFFDEISKELIPDHQDGRVCWRLLGLASVFVLLKVTSAYLFGVNNFLLHAANGGLMQVIWSWKETQKLDINTSSSDFTSDPFHVGGN